MTSIGSVMGVEISIICGSKIIYLHGLHIWFYGLRLHEKRVFKGISGDVWSCLDED